MEVLGWFLRGHGDLGLVLVVALVDLGGFWRFWGGLGLVLVGIHEDFGVVVGSLE